MSRWIFVLCSITWAADSRIESIRDLLAGMREKPEASDDRPRGASPKLTVLKHELRDWIELRMAGLKQDGDVAQLARAVNAELKAAGFLCCGEVNEPIWWFSGYLDDIEFRREHDFLVLITHVGIECGFDDSAYLYGWSAEGWRRTWQTEQNIYEKGKYKPQSIHSVQVSPYNTSNDYLVLTIGREPWCQSNWHDVYYRVFRPGADPEAPPLLDGQVWAFVSETAATGAITANDVLVEYTINRSGGEFVRAMRHYEIDHDKVKRVDPLALRPRDFVEEWLDADWQKEAWHWSESANYESLRQLHEKFRKDRAPVHPTMHCPAAPDLWQVAFDFSNPPTPYGKPPVGTYFLVRWRPPYRFTMVRVSNRLDQKCTERDDTADEDPPTLFPGR